MQITLIFFASACFAISAWAIGFYFRRGGPMPVRMKWIAATGSLGMIANMAGLIWFATSQTIALLAGLGLYASSLSILLWTLATLWQKRPLLAFSTEAAHELCCNGPYGLVRHPFYLAYSLMWLAGAVVIPWFLGWPVFAVMLAQYVAAIRFEERQYLGSELKSAYADYQSRVGMLWPKLWRPEKQSSFEGSPRRG